jgi:plastocyanin
VVVSAAGAAVAVALAGCSGGQDEEDGSADATVEVGPNDEFAFEPGTDEPLRVEAGATVEFVWRSGPHNVVVDSQPDGADWQGHESTEAEGFSVAFTFETPGRYEYFCEPHRSLGMVGALVVEG